MTNHRINGCLDEHHRILKFIKFMFFNARYHISTSMTHKKMIIKVIMIPSDNARYGLFLAAGPKVWRHISFNGVPCGQEESKLITFPSCSNYIFSPCYSSLENPGWVDWFKTSPSLEFSDLTLITSEKNKENTFSTKLEPTDD